MKRIWSKIVFRQIARERVGNFIVIFFVNEENMEQYKKDYFSKDVNILYGGGESGKTFLKMMNKNNIRADFFVDDDPNKWDTQIDGIPVISYDSLRNMSKEQKTNVIITSIYAKLIYNKLKELSLCVFVFSDFLFSLVSAIPDIDEKFDFINWKKRIEKVYCHLGDDFSKHILQILCEMIETGNKDFVKLFDICSDEDHYFIKEVLDVLGDSSVIVDCGAYTGDLIAQLSRHPVNVGMVYAFEVNPEIYRILQMNVAKSKFAKKFVLIQKGIWNTKGNFYLDVGDFATAGKVCNVKSNILVETVVLDEMFKDISVDLVKMDIEGAEMRALQGAEVILQRDRPVLAISIYHSLEDLVDIPLYLANLLEDYVFLIRHHSCVFSETVLYGIPKERLRKVGR